MYICLRIFHLHVEKSRTQSKMRWILIIKTNNDKVPTTVFCTLKTHSLFPEIMSNVSFIELVV